MITHLIELLNLNSAGHILYVIKHFVNCFNRMYRMLLGNKLILVIIRFRIDIR